MGTGMDMGRGTDNMDMGRGSIDGKIPNIRCFHALGKYQKNNYMDSIVINNRLRKTLIIKDKQSSNGQIDPDLFWPVFALIEQNQNKWNVYCLINLNDLNL